LHIRFGLVFAFDSIPFDLILFGQEELHFNELIRMLTWNRVKGEYLCWAALSMVVVFLLPFAQTSEKKRESFSISEVSASMSVAPH